ncbi:MAG: hypothetical protein ACI9O6_002129 [Glaciecola sp.]|jgi:hypothetical protein
MLISLGTWRSRLRLSDVLVGVVSLGRLLPVATAQALVSLVPYPSPPRRRWSPQSLARHHRAGGGLLRENRLFRIFELLFLEADLHGKTAIAMTYLRMMLKTNTSHKTSTIRHLIKPAWLKKQLLQG